jgi:hypothetical protein
MFGPSLAHDVKVDPGTHVERLNHDLPVDSPDDLRGSVLRIAVRAGLPGCLLVMREGRVSTMAAGTCRASSGL